MSLPRLARVVLDNSILLVLGTTTALIWANVDYSTYTSASHVLHFAVNDILMAFFFALAAKEVFEATLPGGSLSSPAQAVSPLAAAAGGMLAPALIYALLSTSVGPSDLLRGWAIPCATDIAFSAMVAKALFPARHPAVPFLLLLAIADDAFGLIILALFYPSGSLSLLALGSCMAGAILAALALRRHGVRSFWPYLLVPGSLSWAGLYLGGFHPALALVPVIPFLPHSARDLGLFDRREERRLDTLSRFEHWWAAPVQVILFFFGFANAGVPLAAIGPGTYYVLAALLVGKPLGILALTLGTRLLGSRAKTLPLRDLALVGICASIGFTVSLFFATAAFPDGDALVQTKMGALFSLAAAPIAWGVSRLFPARRMIENP